MRRLIVGFLVVFLVFVSKTVFAQPVAAPTLVANPLVGEWEFIEATVALPDDSLVVTFKLQGTLASDSSGQFKANLESRSKLLEEVKSGNVPKTVEGSYGVDVSTGTVSFSLSLTNGKPLLMVWKYFIVNNNLLHLESTLKDIMAEGINDQEFQKLSAKEREYLMTVIKIVLQRK